MAKKKPVKLFVILAVLVAGGFYLYQNLGGFITRTAEDIASGALGVRVNIGSIDVTLSDKKVTVNSLEIGNPPGYRNNNAMTAKKIIITLNTASQELIDFKNIEVKGSVVNLEVNEKGMNLVALKNLANRKKQKQSTGSKQIRVIVEHMVIGASVINPSIALVDRDIASIKMPAIKFAGMGKGGGMDADAAIVKVMSKYFTAVEREARRGGVLGAVPGVEDVKKTLDGAASKLEGLFR